MSRVRIIPSLFNDFCQCGTWLKHWEDLSGEEALYCTEKDCFNKEDLVGVHVQKISPDDHDYYIIPLCKMHQASKEELDISVLVELIPANVMASQRN